MPVTDLVGPALDAISDAIALIQPVGRSIGQIYPDVTIEEGHQDESIVTADPVQGGALVTDHIFDRPPSVVIRGGFSNSSAGYVGYVQEQYQELLKLKASKTPFSLSTGKRPYEGMVIQALSVVTDPHSEYVLMFVANCVHINIVKDAKASDPSTAAPASDPANQADPSATAGVSNSGSVSTSQVGETAFAGAFNPGAFSETPSTADLNSGSALGGTLGGSAGFSLSGVSPPPLATGEVGELTASDPAGNALPGATVPASPGYNPFATGAFGGT
jgi:hypothetical protein